MNRFAQYNILFIAFIVLNLSLFSSCRKEVESAIAGKSSATIRFQKPSPESTVKLHEELSIEGIIDSDEMMSGWNIQILASNDSLLNEYSELYEQTQYSFHHHWTPNKPGKVVINISALDANLNTIASNSINISIVP